MNTTQKNHRKALYFLSAFAISLTIGRALYTQHLSFLFLIWNLFLAWIPYWISVYGFKNQEKITSKTAILVLCWLAFLPNAPYLITDFVHYNNEGKMKWLDIVLLSTYATTGILLFHKSLSMFKDAFLKNVTARIKQMSLLLILASSAYGIYLGRVLRFNSWNVITDPFGLSKSIFQSVFSAGHFQHTLYITALFMVFLYISVIVFDYLLSPAHEEKN